MDHSMDDEVKPKRIPVTALFSESDKLWTEENNHVNNNKHYSSSAETSVDFNYAEVASCDDDKEELDEQQHSIMQYNGEALEYTNLHHPHEESNVIKNVVYFNSLKKNTINTTNAHTLRSLSNNLIRQIEALYNCQLQQYISESGNTALYKYMQPTANSLLDHKFTLPRYITPGCLQSNVRIDEGLSKMAVTPVFHKYQLLGDSQLLRFSEAILGLRRWRSKGSKARIGYCVSGQCVAELGARIRARECHLKSSVLVLIGTNDMRRNSDVLPIMEAYSDLVAQLERHCEKIVLLTVPPLPFIHDKDPKMHIDRLKIVNGFIKELGNENNIFVLDLCSIFISFDNTVSKEYFEKFIRDDKVDLIHLNKFGLKMLRTLLDTQYFDKYKV